MLEFETNVVQDSTNVSADNLVSTNCVRVSDVPVCLLPDLLPTPGTDTHSALTYIMLSNPVNLANQDNYTSAFG